MFSNQRNATYQSPGQENKARPISAVTTPSGDVYERAQDTLRSLREEIVIFRDPEVRRHLDTIPLPKTSETAPDYPLSQTPAQLNAAIIDLRTRLQDTTLSLNSAKETEILSRKRAARAEGQVEELRKQLEEESQNHAQAIKNATKRIESLEKENEAVKEKNEEDLWSLKRSIELDRYGNKTLEVERDTAVKEANKIRSRIESLEEELEVTKQKLSTEKRINLARSQQVSGKLSNMERELGLRRHGRLSIDSKTSEDLKQARQLIEKLQNESVELKSDLESQTSEANELRKKLSEADDACTIFKTKYNSIKGHEREIANLKREITTLRKVTKASNTSASQIRALTAEKDRIISMIAPLSSTGDVTEGLKILKNSASQNDGSSSLELNSKLKELELRHKEEISRLSEETASELNITKVEIEKYREQLQKVQSQLTASQSEVSNLTSTLKRREVIERVLEKEQNHYKAALGEITAEVMSMTSDSNTDAVKRLKEHFENIESVTLECKGIIKQLDKTLLERTTEIQDLKTKLASSTSVLPEDGIQTSSINRLKNQLESRSRAFTKATEEKEKAESEARLVKGRLAEVEEELSNLKLQTKEPLPIVKDGPPDFNSQQTRVLHFQQNPLALAMKNAQENNESLKSKKRLRLDVDAMISPDRGVAGTELVALRKRVEELMASNHQLQKSSKIGMRTGEIARKKIEEVRIAVYTLFGWSMRINGAKYIINSIYAEGPGDQLIFGINENGGMSLMETEYASQLSDEINEYVRKMDSIPALLAHITADNFSKTTAFAG